MPGPRTTLLIEGSFRELVEELADYVDNIKKTQTDSAGSLRSEVAPLLDRYTQAETSQDEDQLENARDDVLKVVVPQSTVLNSTSDKGMPHTSRFTAYGELTPLVLSSC